jgi:hypothetical protein
MEITEENDKEEREAKKYSDKIEDEKNHVNISNLHDDKEFNNNYNLE